jgi:enoyl-CoA hydratase/carnithine racemase
MLKNRGFLKESMPTSTQQNTLRFEVNKQGILTLWLDGGEKSVVILNRELIQRLNTTLDAIEQRSDIKGLIVRSDCDRVFVAGADLEEIDGLDDQGLHAYLAFGTTVFARIAALTFPTVATLHGAALGGGLEIAMHCNALMISKVNSSGKPFPVGLPEAGLGICPGWGGTQLLPSRISPETGIISAATGSPFMSNDLPKGLATQLVDTPETLQEIAELWIQENATCGATPLGMQPENVNDWNEGLGVAQETISGTPAARAVFYAVETGIQEGWSAAVAVEQCELVRLRNTPVAREKLDAFLSKG